MGHAHPSVMAVADVERSLAALRCGAMTEPANLPDELANELAAQARQAAQFAHAPYSKFSVGAVAVAADGSRFVGANVENAAYPSSTCAEVTAIVKAASEGVRRIDVVAVACVAAPSVDDAYPCGNCRQVMNEFGVTTVIVTAADGTEVRQHPLADLLPHSFTL